jgi:hypothetical protein
MTVLIVLIDLKLITFIILSMSEGKRLMTIQ